MPLGTGVGVKDYTRTPQDKQRGNSFLYSENRKTIWSSENSAGISDKGAQWVGGSQTLSGNSCAMFLRRSNHALAPSLGSNSPARVRGNRAISCLPRTMQCQQRAYQQWTPSTWSPPNGPKLVKALGWVAWQGEP